MKLSSILRVRGRRPRGGTKRILEDIRGYWEDIGRIFEGAKSARFCIVFVMGGRGVKHFHSFQKVKQ